ncbi:MAG: VCBS repeat-containing protein, partial [Ignavibacteria bacterium]|nr:VCBS repeat-containing protein [Ignavibacteria bacterium]
MKAGISLLAILYGVTSAVPAHGQTWQKEVYSIPVSGAHGTIEHPFTGGIYNPMHQFADIDTDGDLDLFVFEPSDGRFSFFRNEGTPSEAMFRYERDPFVLPDPFGWFGLADINGDSKLDLMTSPPSSNSLMLYLNTGTLQAPQFSLWTSALLDSAGQVVYSESYSLSSLTDMDGDGDPDFLSLNTSIGTINYYENIGTPAVPLLAFRTARYQNIQICIGCGDGSEGSHGNGSLHLSDIDGDGDNDLLYGDLFHTGLYFFENVGTPGNAVLDSVTAWFPFDDPVVTPGFNQATLADIDNDGDKDLFVSVMASLVGVDNFRFLSNESAGGELRFVESTRNFLETVDFGLQAAPVFVDIDADGDEDLFVGNLDGDIAFIRNTGSATVPAFLIEDTAFVSSPTAFLLAPTFADIDADGDQDLFVGHFGGKIEFHRNTGTAMTPVFERELWLFDTLSIGSYTGPAFMDMEGDGDLDLFI